MRTLRQYQKSLTSTLQSADNKMVEQLISQIVKVVKTNKRMFICGNGGSSSTSDHFAVDLGTGSLIRNSGVRAFSLTSNSSVITAIGNDVNFDSVFAKQIELYGESGDLLLVISASGNSTNLIEVIQTAKKKSIFVAALVGFDGGKIQKLVDLSIHTKSDLNEYGIVEDAHLSIAHYITERVRLEI